MLTLPKRLLKKTLTTNQYYNYQKFYNDIKHYFLYLKNKLFLKKKILVFLTSLKNLSGLEIAGPSWLWSQGIPIYMVIKKLDNVNIATDFIDKNARQTGAKKYIWFLFKKGGRFIADTTNLKLFKSQSYDFVISRGVFGHIANPLKAVEEWNRVIKNQGFLVIAASDKKYSFEHKRPFTTFEHVLDDYKKDVTEHDLTHYDENLKLNDSIDPNYPKITKEGWIKLLSNNFEKRSITHHVFDKDVLSKIVEFFNFKVIEIIYIHKCIVLLAKKNI